MGKHLSRPGQFTKTSGEAARHGELADRDDEWWNKVAAEDLVEPCFECIDKKVREIFKLPPEREKQKGRHLATGKHLSRPGQFTKTFSNPLYLGKRKLRWFRLILATSRGTGARHNLKDGEALQKI